MKKLILLPVFLDSTCLTICFWTCAFWNNIWNNQDPTAIKVCFRIIRLSREVLKVMFSRFYVKHCHSQTKIKGKRDSYFQKHQYFSQKSARFPFLSSRVLHKLSLLNRELLQTWPFVQMDYTLDMYHLHAAAPHDVLQRPNCRSQDTLSSVAITATIQWDLNTGSNGGSLTSLHSLKVTTKEFLSLLHLTLHGCDGW